MHQLHKHASVNDNEFLAFLIIAKKFYRRLETALTCMFMTVAHNCNHFNPHVVTVRVHYAQNKNDDAVHFILIDTTDMKTCDLLFSIVSIWQ